jgi:heme O synthase-like polyprenyltransferase
MLLIYSIKEISIAYSFVGAIQGAPPLIGYVAAHGYIDNIGRCSYLLVLFNLFGNSHGILGNCMGSR